LAKNLELGDLVSRKDREGELYIVIGYTYRVSRWGNQRVMKVFCSTTGRQMFVLESILIIINSANSKKSS
jgi:hypothetical protein